MIEVTIWHGNVNGDGYSKYLIDIPTDGFGRPDYFTSTPTVTAVRRALIEFSTQHSNCRMSKIDIRETPDKVLQP